MSISGDESADIAPLTAVEIKKLKIKDIRKRLEARGQKCSGCVEKDEYVAKYLEVQHMPLVERPKAPATEDKAPMDREKLDELMSQLKGSGMNFQAFTPQDLEGLSPEQMATKFGGNGRGRKGSKGGRGAGNSKKSTTTSTKTKVEESDTVEL